MKLLLILLFVSLQSQAQYKIKFKEHKTSLVFTALQGLSDGFRDASLFGRMRNDGPWFNGLESWQNKWKNGDPAQGEKFFLSSTVLAFTTDAPHASNMVSNLSGECAKALMPNMQGASRWQKVKIVFIYTLVRSAAHNLIFGLIYKVK